MILLSRLSQTISRTCAFVVISLCLAFFVVTLHWPFLGDATLIRYGLFLIHHGLTPYRDFVEINLPGAYFTDFLAEHLFGPSAVGWRFYDMCLLVLAGLSMQLFALRGERLAACIAAGMFALAHGGDGIAQAGQRDLAIAVLLCAGTGCLFQFLKNGHRAAWVAGFGILHGWAATIKPTAVLITIPCLVVAVVHLRRARKPAWIPAGVAITSLLLPGCIAAVYLWRYKALSSFWFVFHVLLPYHAQLSRRPISYLLLHSISPFISLFALWCLCLCIGRRELSMDLRRTLLVLCSLSGLAIYIAQGKGFPYHRYPLFVFLLPLIFFDANTLLHSPRRTAVTAAVATIVVGACVLAPMRLARILRYIPKDVFRNALVADLNELGGGALNQRVQCLDTARGCIAALGSMKLEQSASLFYDEFVFGPIPGPAVDASRARFWQEIHARPPLVFILEEDYFISDSNYAKLRRWPAFQDFLASHYVLYADRRSPGVDNWWGRPAPSPGYRLYVWNAGNR